MDSSFDDKFETSIEVVSIKRTPIDEEHYAHNVNFKSNNKLINKKYWDYYKLLYDLAIKKYYLKDHYEYVSNEYPMDGNLDEFKQRIESFLKFLQSSQDLMTEPLVTSFFELENKKLFRLHFKSFFTQLSNLVPLNMYLSEGDKYLILGFQNSAPISRIGKIWSFIDPEIMGKIKTYDVKWTNEDVEIKKLKEFKFEKRITYFHYQAKTHNIIMGFESGEVMVTSLVNGEKIKSMLVFDDIIVDICEVGNYIFMASPQSLKIMTKIDYELVGGGSLKKRLENDKITAISVDNDKKVILLGTIDGEVMLYKFTQKQDSDLLELGFINQYPLDENCIEKIKIYGPNIFCAHGPTISANKLSEGTEIKLEQNAVFRPDGENFEFLTSETVTDFTYIPHTKHMIGTYSNGVLLIWNAKDGTVIGARQDHTSKTMTLLTSDTHKSIMTCSYDSTLNVWDMASQ